jgi:hypothetical protein
MVLTLDNAGALVPGVKIKEASVEMQKVKILRTFVGLPPDTKIGSIVMISKLLAVQAKDAHKVEFIPSDAKPGPEAAKPEIHKEPPPPPEEHPIASEESKSKFKGKLKD